MYCTLFLDTLNPYCLLLSFNPFYITICGWYFWYMDRVGRLSLSLLKCQYTEQLSLLPPPTSEL